MVSLVGSCQQQELSWGVGIRSMIQEGPAAAQKMCCRRVLPKVLPKPRTGSIPHQISFWGSSLDACWSAAKLRQWLSGTRTSPTACTSIVIRGFEVLPLVLWQPGLPPHIACTQCWLVLDIFRRLHLPTDLHLLLHLECLAGYIGRDCVGL